MIVDYILVGALILLPGTLLSVVYTFPSSVFNDLSNLHMACRVAFIVNILTILFSAVLLIAKYIL